MEQWGFKDKSTAERLKQMAIDDSKVKDTKHTDQVRQIKPTVFTSTSDVPAWACIRMTAATVLETAVGAKMPIVTASKPGGTDTSLTTIFLNGGNAVAANDRGTAQFEDLQRALYNENAPSAFGTEVGPVSGEWYLSEENPIVKTHVFVADLGNGVMVVRPKKVGKHFDVDLKQTGGEDGSATERNTWTYEVRDENGVLLETDYTIHNDAAKWYTTPELGRVKPANWGRAFYDNAGTLVIRFANEYARRKECPNKPTPPPGPINLNDQRNAAMEASVLNISAALDSPATRWVGSFDGASHLGLGNPAALQITDALSVVIWFNTSDSIATTNSLITKWVPTGNERGFYLLLPSSNAGVVRWLVSNSGTSADVLIETTETFNDGNDHFAVATFEANVAAHLYVDGVLRASDTSPGSAIHNSAADCLIGARDESTIDNFLVGQGWNAMIFNRILSAQEIWDLYLKRSDVPIDTPTGNWLTTAAGERDVSDNELHATNNGVKFINESE